MRITSTYRLAKPYSKQRHTNHFMLKYLVALFLIFTGVSMSAQCGFPSDGDGGSCPNATLVCSNELQGMTGTLPLPFAIDPQSFNDVCTTGGSIDNPIWLAFVPCQADVEIEICPSNCTTSTTFIGMHGGIYNSCDSPDNALACRLVGTTDCYSLSSVGFVPGQTYYLLLDGYGASVCDYTINVIKGLAESEFTLIQDPLTNEITQTPETTCNPANQTYTYSIPECEVEATGCNFPDLNIFNLACYEWTFTPNTVTFLGDPTDPEISVIFDQPGKYTIEVERILHPYIEKCSTGDCNDPLSICVDIQFLDTINNGTTFICPGEFANICGDLIGLPGVYECIDTLNCIITIDTLSFGTNEMQNLGNIFLCGDECFILEEVEYCDRISYNVASNVDCNLSYQFEIKDLEISITEPDEYPTLDCNLNSEFVIQVVNTNYSNELSYEYKDENGIIISTDIFVNVTEPGTYTFYAFSEPFKSTCIDSIVFMISQDTSVIEISLQADTLTCDDREALLTISSTDVIESFKWVGPGIQNGSSTDAFADLPGQYIVNAIGENGCESIDTIEVIEILLPAEIDIDWNDLDCQTAQSALKYLSDITIDSVLWTGPMGFVDTSQNPIVTEIGKYTLHVFGSNGCDYAQVFEILGNFRDPVYETIQAEEWGCLTQTLEIDVEYSDTSDFDFIWSSTNGIIEDGINEEIVTVGSVGIYYVEITDNSTGCSIVDSIEVLANEAIPTDVVIDSASPICFNINDGMIQIGEVTGGEEPYTYMLNDQIITNTLIEDLSPAEYEITIQDDNGCELKRIVTIQQPNELFADMIGPDEANFEDNVILISDVDPMFIIDIINWYNSEGELLASGPDFSFILLETTTIIMEVIDSKGCTVIKTRTISLDEDFDYFLPNTFTPNQDGINDFFTIYPQDLPGKIETFLLFDRWGNKVFEATNIDYSEIRQGNWGWDGKQNGVNVSQGVYVFYAKVETLGIPKELKGSVTLVR